MSLTTDIIFTSHKLPVFLRADQGSREPMLDRDMAQTEKQDQDTIRIKINRTLFIGPQKKC